MHGLLSDFANKFYLEIKLWERIIHLIGNEILNQKLMLMTNKYMHIALIVNANTI